MTAKSLTHEDKRQAFLRATGGMSEAATRWRKRAEAPMTDEALAEALAYEMGIFGGSSGPDSMSLTWQASGLKIWAAWEIINHTTTRPVFQGGTTIAMARVAYGIHVPGDEQLSLFA